MYKRKLSRFAVFFLAGAVAIAQLTVPVFAKDTYGEVQDEMTVGGQKFYDIYAGSEDKQLDMSDELTFYAEMLRQKGLLEKWAGLAYAIFRGCNTSSKEDEAVTYIDHSGKGFDKAFGEGHYIDLVDVLVNGRNLGGTPSGDSDKYSGTGLTVANNLQAVERRMGEVIESAVNRKLEPESFIKHSPIDILHDTTEQTVLYTIAGGVDKEGGTGKYEYNGFGIAFYDFQIMLLMDDRPYNTAYGDMSMEEAIENQDGIEDFSYTTSFDPNKVTYTYLVNESGKESSLTRQTGESSTVTVANSVSKSRSYQESRTLGTAVTYALKFGIEGTGIEMGLDLNYSFQATDAVGTAFGKEESKAYTSDSTVSATIPIPGHAVGSLATTEATGNKEFGFDCPLSLSYKVAIFSICGECYDDNVGVQSFSTAGYYQHSFYTEFGSDIDNSDAVTNLYERGAKQQAVNGYEESRGNTKGYKYHDYDILSTSINKLDWTALDSKGDVKSKAHPNLGSCSDIVDDITYARPMCATGATMNEIIKESVIKVGSTQPLYPIKSIRPNTPKMRYDIEPGETIRAGTIALNAFNEYDVLFYGFDKRNGKWKLVDENYQPLSPSIAVIDENPDPQGMYYYSVTGVGPGSGYMTYEIDENKYSYYQSTTTIKNKDIELPYIPFSVSGADPLEFNGRVEAEGEVTLMVGEEAVDINTIEGVSATVYDERDKEMDVQVIWEAQETELKGIIVSENMISVSLPGSFHIRATYEDEYSEWIPVTAVLGEGKELPVLSRGDLAIILYHYFGSEGLNGILDFVDINPQDPSKRYEKAVMWAGQHGLMNGVSPNSFGVDKAVTKEQLITILYKLAVFKGVDVATELEEAIKQQIYNSNVQPWARDAIMWAISNGMIPQEELDKFLEQPDEPVTIDEFNDMAAPLVEPDAPSEDTAPAPPEEEQEIVTPDSEETVPPEGEQEAVPEDEQQAISPPANGQNTTLPGDSQLSGPSDNSGLTAPKL